MSQFINILFYLTILQTALLLLQQTANAQYNDLLIQYNGNNQYVQTSDVTSFLLDLTSIQEFYWLELQLQIVIQPQNELIKILTVVSTYSLLKAGTTYQQVLQQGEVINKQQIVLYDYDTYATKGFTHTVRVPPSFTSTQQRFITIYRVPPQSSSDPSLAFTYSLNFNTLGQICQRCEANPQNCPSSPQAGYVCNCQLPQIGTDCNLNAPQVALQTTASIAINSLVWGYLQYELDTQTPNFQITVVPISQNGFGVSFFFPGVSTGDVPNLLTNYYDVAYGSNNNVFYISQQFIINIYNQIGSNSNSVTMIVGLYNKGAQQSSVQITVQSSLGNGGSGGLPGWALYLFTALAVCGVCFMIVVVCAIVRGAVNFEQNRSRSRVTPLLVVGLTPELIQKYLPSQEHSKLLKTFKTEDTQILEDCTICLLGYEENPICRVTICKHIFHKDCLDQWLIRNNVCPNCRHDHSLAALEQNYKANLQKASEQQLLKAQSETNFQQREQLSNGGRVTMILRTLPDAAESGEIGSLTVFPARQERRRNQAGGNSAAFNSRARPSNQNADENIPNEEHKSFIQEFHREQANITVDDLDANHVVPRQTISHIQQGAQSQQQLAYSRNQAATNQQQQNRIDGDNGGDDDDDDDNDDDDDEDSDDEDENQDQDYESEVQHTQQQSNSQNNQNQAMQNNRRVGSLARIPVQRQSQNLYNSREEEEDVERFELSSHNMVPHTEIASQNSNQQQRIATITQIQPQHRTSRAQRQRAQPQTLIELSASESNLGSPKTLVNLPENQQQAQRQVTNNQLLSPMALRIQQSTGTLSNIQEFNFQGQQSTLQFQQNTFTRV